MEDFCTADGTGDGNAAAHLVATPWHTWSHSTCNAPATFIQPFFSRQLSANRGKSRQLKAGGNIRS